MATACNREQVASSWPKSTANTFLHLLSCLKSEYRVGGLMIFALLLAQLRAGAFEFEASGTIEKVEIEINKARQKAATKRGIKLPQISAFNFHAYVRDCRWRISVSPKVVTGVRPSIARTEAGSDGFQTYVIMYPGEVVLRQAASGKEIRTNAVAQIFAGPVLFGVDTVPIIWLALCSRCYFSTVTNSNIIPIHLIRAPGAVEPKDFYRRASWELLSSKGKFPSQLQYFYDELVRVRSDGKVEALKLDPPFDKGYVMASYRVTSLTNNSDFEMPLEFRFEVLRPDYERSKTVPETKLTRVWIGRVTDFRDLNPLSDAEHVPILPGQTPIADWRLADEGVALVGHKTNVWPQLDKVRKLEVEEFRP